jgi:hypothetical protein
MKLAQIVLPVFDNEGDSLQWAHDYLAHLLLEKFGGYTRLNQATGAWKNGDRVQIEGVYVYLTAVERAAVIDLRDIAAKVAREAKQDCVMIVTPNGDVEFIKPKGE